ncbi:DUF2846 domain-containing protein [Rhodanobacter ginsengisoli]|uniref:DUF2846 domain-containing protein n=1 Tax=Rhodanobacter ginsengisoli TaxID=418646 RepID=A0ABW0QPR4_9GAMM
MRILVVGLLLAAFSGCATKPFVVADASAYASQGSIYDGQATVYVMRDTSGAGMAWPANVRLDGVQKGSLRRETYVRFAATPGRHDILAHWNRLSALREVAFNSDFKSGKTYYVVIGTSFAAYAGIMQIGTNLGLVKPSVGAQLVATYHDRTPGAGQ